jgi:nucleoside-diphosphate-sugar epimerase
MRVLVTGGTGFVGTHTVQHLVRQGYVVRCLVRSTSDRSRLPEEVELAEGHLLNFASLQRAAADCWGVIHVGGVVRVRVARDFLRVNRDGTANLTKAAREAGVERFVLCGSQAAAGPTPRLPMHQGNLPRGKQDY